MELEYGKTYVVMPKGKHKATIVWLHGLGGNGGRYSFPFNFLCSQLALIVDDTDRYF